MAVVKAPALSLDASGNMGGICYSKWRGLSIARDVWTGTVPNTTKQVTIQGYMTTASQAWSGLLTEKQREKWRAAAQEEVRVSRVRTKYIPTGYQYFMQLNMQVLRKYTALLEEPPPKLFAFGFGVLETEEQAGTGNLRTRCSELLTPQPDGYYKDVWLARGFTTAGRHAIDPEYKFVHFFSPLTTWTTLPKTVGTWHWVRCRWWHDSGRVGNWFEKQQFIT